MTHPFPCSTHRQPRKNKGQDHFASCKGSFVKGEWKSKPTTLDSKTRLTPEVLYLILSLSVVSNVFSNVLGTFICIAINLLVVSMEI